MQTHTYKTSVRGASVGNKWFCDNDIYNETEDERYDEMLVDRDTTTV